MKAREKGKSAFSFMTLHHHSYDVHSIFMLIQQLSIFGLRTIYHEDKFGKKIVSRKFRRKILIQKF